MGFFKRAALTLRNAATLERVFAVALLIAAALVAQPVGATSDQQEAFTEGRAVAEGAMQADNLSQPETTGDDGSTRTALPGFSPAGKTGTGSSASNDAPPEDAVPGFDPTTSGKRFSYPIRPGDLVVVTMEEDPDVKYDGQVSASGLINLPFLGKYIIAGKNESEAEAALEKALEEDLYVDATVSITVVQRAPGDVYIYGAVKSPGKVSLPPTGSMTILEAVAEVGGVTTWAAPENTYILRQSLGEEKRERIDVNIFEALKQIDTESNVHLVDNDVIFIPSSTGMDSVLSNQPLEIIVTGEINRPGIVQFAPGERCTFVRAIFKAGNFSRFAKKNRVRLIRYNRDGSREVKVINAEHIIDEGYLADDIELKAGDMLIVDQKMINF